MVINGGARAASQRWSDSQLLQPLPYSPCPGRKRDCRLVGYITPRSTPLQCLLYLQAFRSTETSSPVAGAGGEPRSAEQGGRRDGGLQDCKGSSKLVMARRGLGRDEHL